MGLSLISRAVEVVNRSFLRFGLTSLLIVFLTCIAGSAGEIGVPEDCNTITEALSIAEDGDVISVATDTYSALTGESFPLRLTKAVTLEGNPRNKPHLQGDGEHTVVLIETGGATLRGFRITDGKGSEGINSMDGGGVCVFVGPGETTEVTIDSCLIENNTCPSSETYDGCGGGIYCGGTYCTCFQININQCTVRQNSVHGQGGGVFCALLSTVDVNDTEVAENIADDHGGGVFVDVYASIDMTNTYIQCNISPGDPVKPNWGGKGGGLACESYGLFSAANCVFVGNTARYYGGGIFTKGGLFAGDDLCTERAEFPRIVDSTIEKNNAELAGGGVYVTSGGILDLANTKLYWNDAGRDGGGLFVGGSATVGGEVTFKDGCLLEGNESARRGGGIYLGSNATGILETTRLLGNSSHSDGGAMYLEEAATGSLTNCIMTYNNSARGNGGGIYAAQNTQLDLMHCTVVGNFVPHNRGGLFMDAGSTANISRSILWRNAGGSIEVNGATVDLRDSMNEDDDPNCDPMYVGWGPLDEIHVDSSGRSDGPGSSDSPYRDLQDALDGFDFHLADDSPCLRNDGYIGADTGTGGTAGNIVASLNLKDGTYNIRGRNIIFINGIQGAGAAASTIKGAVLGCIEDSSFRNLSIAGEEIFGGLTIRANSDIVDCNIVSNTVLSYGGGVYLAQGRCSMSGSVISGNLCGERGGGVYLAGGTRAEIERSLIKSNDSLVYGGGVFHGTDTVMRVIGSEISSNKAHQGGGIYVNGQLQVISSLIRGNTTTHGTNNQRKGGGIYSAGSADVSVIDTELISNIATWYAGAIWCEGNIQIEASLFDSNRSRYGGALCVTIGSTGAFGCRESRFINNSTSYNGGVMYVNSSTAPPLFSKCEFTANTARHGGVGICYDNSHVIFQECTFEDNIAANNHGGCFYLQSTGTRFQDCVFKNSSANQAGGVALFWKNDISYFEDCRIEGASANTAGGAFCIEQTSKPVFSNVTITNGRCTNYGGGVSIHSTASPVFEELTVSECEAIYGGGVYACQNSQSIFTMCRFNDNRAFEESISADGGGAFFTENAAGLFTRCAFSGNTAKDDGGGMGVAENSRVDLCNTLFAGNAADDDGGGIHFTSGSTGTLTNCTLTLNSAVHGGTGGAVYMEPDNVVTLDSTIIWNNSPDGIQTEGAPVVNCSCCQKAWPGRNNIVADPMFESDTFALMDGSPCIDAGNPDPNMNDACLPPGKETVRNDMGYTGGPDNCEVDCQSGFEFVDFSSSDSVVLLGNARLKDGFLRLTEAEQFKVGGAWYAFPVRVDGGFETVFDFRIDRDGRDGIAFVIQNNSLAALGSTAQYIGYNIPNSLAVEFDTHRNGGYGDTNANHISIQTRGTLTNSPNHAYSLGYSDTIPALSDNQVHTAKIVYGRGRLSVYIDNMQAPVLNVMVDLAETLSLHNGHAFVGFTASTRAGLVETHDIMAWSFASTPGGNVE